MKIPDKPISHFNDDQLGRSSLAKYLAQAYNNSVLKKDGFTWAITGKWGSGKTSFLELMCLHLDHLEMSRLNHKVAASLNSPTEVTIIELEDMALCYRQIEPSLDEFSGQPEGCFWYDPHRLKQFERLTDTREDALKADHYWRLKRAIAREGRHIIVRFNPWIFAGRTELATALFSEIASAAGNILSKDAKKAFGELVDRFIMLGAPLGAVAAPAIPLFDKIIKAVTESASGYAKTLTTSQPIDSIREELCVAMRKLGDRTILVIVDDIDRLKKSEFIEIVSLLKSVGNLPNISYLLCYDDALIDESKSTDLLSDDIREYIEKIVQYKLEIPPPESGDIDTIFTQLLSSVEIEINDFDARRLTFAWSYIVRHYLTDPRKIKALINSFSMAFSAVDGRVDVVDLLLIETFRLFQRNAFAWIKDNIDDLVDQ